MILSDPSEKEQIKQLLIEKTVQNYETFPAKQRADQ